MRRRATRSTTDLFQTRSSLPASSNVLTTLRRLLLSIASLVLTSMLGISFSVEISLVIVILPFLLLLPPLLFLRLPLLPLLYPLLLLVLVSTITIMDWHSNFFLFHFFSPSSFSSCYLFFLYE